MKVPSVFKSKCMRRRKDNINRETPNRSPNPRSSPRTSPKIRSSPISIPNTRTPNSNPRSTGTLRDGLSSFLRPLRARMRLASGDLDAGVDEHGRRYVKARLTERNIRTFLEESGQMEVDVVRSAVSGEDEWYLALNDEERNEAEQAVRDQVRAWRRVAMWANDVAALRRSSRTLSAVVDMDGDDGSDGDEDEDDDDDDDEENDGEEEGEE
ncbi:hypothetical protein FQN49_005091 [Arthroderma sp. PD_2]|nr:hypothetical protein FQN49_005091 [Arthroderma sp. PD_2]